MVQAFDEMAMEGGSGGGGGSYGLYNPDVYSPDIVKQETFFEQPIRTIDYSPEIYVPQTLPMEIPLGNPSVYPVTPIKQPMPVDYAPAPYMVPDIPQTLPANIDQVTSVSYRWETFVEYWKRFFSELTSK